MLRCCRTSMLIFRAWENWFIKSLCAFTELVMPWDWRTESKTARKRRLDRELQREKEVQQCLVREKYNSIDQYLLSGDEKVLLEKNIKHSKTGQFL